MEVWVLVSEVYDEVLEESYNVVHGVYSSYEKAEYARDTYNGAMPAQDFEIEQYDVDHSYWE